ncbi:hypothetical protein CAPTEDRAFT_189170 [Capitella teleta]|uniref:C2H2-type domain-containing protein n=1 Tax=Capitella teleta TaxID=283909 RepID=R7UPY8_CAPTE|nr:hypothetical protein CAPTEDRAFT_189170 [Capitella teleta]|eukprot:ELU08265.1 hypothetical protein CAPTEDRAFT_189170 [Capitella teleta]
MRFKTKQHLRQHALRHTGEKPFACPYCSHRCNRKGNLDAHNQKCPFRCYICHQRFSSHADVKQHLKMHSDDPRFWRTYACQWSGCAKAFSNLSHYKRHILTHTGQKPFSCRICQAAFALKGNLVFVCYVCKIHLQEQQLMRQHLATHFTDPVHWKPFGCDWPHCKKGFDSKANLTRHQLIHTKERPYQCMACGKRFNQRANLSTHFKRVHVLRCYICREPFSEMKELRDHLKLHTDEPRLWKPYCCPVAQCERAFTCPKDLSRHSRVPARPSTFVCQFCKLVLPDRALMLEHLQKTHDPSALRPYGCAWPQCSKAFHSHSELQRHTRVHTKQRPFQCGYCGRGFSQKSNMVLHIDQVCYICKLNIPSRSQMAQHLETHEGADTSKLFGCPWGDCDKAFKSRWDIQRHYSVHTQTKTFVCGMCGARFSRKYSLLRHTQKQHSDIEINVGATQPQISVGPSQPPPPPPPPPPHHHHHNPHVVK